MFVILMINVTMEMQNHNQFTCVKEVSKLTSACRQQQPRRTPCQLMLAVEQLPPLALLKRKIEWDCEKHLHTLNLSSVACSTLKLVNVVPSARPANVSDLGLLNIVQAIFNDDNLAAIPCLGQVQTLFRTD